jgi:hypothetical protein
MSRSRTVSSASSPPAPYVAGYVAAPRPRCSPARLGDYTAQSSQRPGSVNSEALNRARQSRFWTSGRPRSGAGESVLSQIALPIGPSGAWRVLVQGSDLGGRSWVRTSDPSLVRIVTTTPPTCGAAHPCRSTASRSEHSRAPPSCLLPGAKCAPRSDPSPADGQFELAADEFNVCHVWAGRGHQPTGGPGLALREPHRVNRLQLHR